ncbi:MAG: YicC family protein [Clostridia bacterium]|nr:YicC family protein [Clostridia bacterium]
MKSMTGYGKGVAERENKTLTVELKAVNNRFLEINARLPKWLLAGDEVIRKEIASVIKRGSIDFFYDYKSVGGEKTITVDNELASLYVDAAKGLGNRFGVKDTLTAYELLRFGDVVTVTTESDTEVLLEMLVEATQKAVIALDEMRKKEGESVKQDFEKIVGNIKEHLSAVTERAPQVVADHKDKLKKRIEEYLGDVEIDEARLLNEVAFFADKADINEEISRLGSHIQQFVATLGKNGELGRQLDFLAQEMNREVNTMGSKSNDITITSHVVAMKNEIEKIKEQVRNVE